MAKWIADGSVGFTIEGDVVTYVDNEGVDNAFNAMWQDGDGVLSGKHYWKIHFPTLKDGASVGFTSKDHFKKGYACRAIQYLGNLSDGSCLLVGDFGPSPQQGDTIGIMAAFEGDRLKMYVDVNGKSLGLAFDVPASTFKSIYPVVSFNSTGSATCTKQTEIPDIFSRATTTFTGIEGDWELTNLAENDVGLDLICSVTAKIRKSATDTDSYTLHVSVINYMGTQLSKVDGNWKTSGVCSTMMGGDPESMEFERTIGSLIKNVKVVEVDGNGNLSFNSDTMSSNWTRYDSTPGAFVGEPFS